MRLSAPPLLASLLSSALVACGQPKLDGFDDPAPTGSDSATDSTGADSGTGGTGGTTDTDISGLNGAAPSGDTSLPTFTAQNMDGSPRTRDDLLGHPTVMWFYPLANTGG